MSRIDVTLSSGLKIGQTTEKEVTLREASAGDMIDATSDAEKVVMTPDGYQLVASPALVGIGVLARQIEKLGSFDGAVTVSMLRGLTQADLAALQEAADKLDRAALEAVSKRGRNHPPSKGA